MARPTNPHWALWLGPASVEEAFTWEEPDPSGSAAIPIPANREPAMTRLLRALASAFSSDHREEVHFHQGPTGAPAVCHDGRCTSPRLDVS